MSAPESPIRLERYDDAPEVTPDPALWSANLEALRALQPDLAAELERVRLPESWRCVRALDGWITYRIEPPGAPPRWLADTAAPLTRAAGLLSELRCEDQNPSLACLGAGAELHLLLAGLPAHRAVYVFEPDPVTLAAVLRTRSLADDLTRGRCILVPPAREQAFLRRLLAEHPGLLSPGMIVCPPGLPRERIAFLQSLCEQVARETHDARQQRLEVLARSGTPAPVETEVFRLGVVGTAPDALVTRASADLAAAARELNWPVVACTCRGPRDVHPLAACETLAAFGPQVTLHVKAPAAQLPLTWGRTCEWYLRAEDVPDALPADDRLRLAATPRVLAALERAAGSAERVAAWYWGCPVDPPPPPGEIDPDQLLLVGDYPDDRPEACGLVQPSHRRLWETLHEIAARRWDTADIARPNALLRRAEQAAGVNLGSGPARALLLKAVERVLVPAIVLRRVVETLGADVRLRTAGHGWQRWTAKEIEPFVESGDALGNTLGRDRALGAVVVGTPDPLTPTLLELGARGWPLIVFAPGGHPLTHALGGILHPGQHYQPFAGASELRAAVRALRSDPAAARRRAAKAREHLLASHTTRHRLAELKVLLFGKQR